MFATRTLSGAALLCLVAGFTTTANAQFFGPNYCCTPYMPQPVVAAPMAYAPTVQTASVSDCPCMKPVTSTVYKEVDVVEYRTVEKQAQVPKVVTVMEDREVVTYQTINETKTVDVPTYVNQTVTEVQPMTQNNSYWRTTWQPVPKMSPCLYDGRPGLVGELNRLGYAFRNTMTPNAVARREYIPNVVTYNVPVQRVVQVPTTRQVTYNVAKVIPVTTTQKVAVQKTVWEPTTYTAYEPYTTKKRVAVGTQTRMVYVDPTGGTTAKSNEPTPATAGGNDNSQSAARDKGTLNLNSVPTGSEIPLQSPVYRKSPEPTPSQQDIEPTPSSGPVATQPQGTPSVIQVAGWQTSRAKQKATPETPPSLVVPTLVAKQ
ncbi:hypothetical protein KOR42_06410 [Thalassoglobus neptunius]|uniref:Uncharacterized protein n=1 Tax=Thalassoglobus neptunius TaxID=1938619 RepID=A0A5C5X5I7_9PLAN|nr:hypothetical protein [Thalassoglobus neptunius]TWT57282.1 hypothetical protein KOR42_06410 [Thalassoglobus neptunius]